MDWVTHIKAAAGNLFIAKLRSFLAILGILVGSGAVVALLTCGKLATEQALSQFKSLGTNLISMSLVNRPGVKSDQSSGLLYSDMPMIRSASTQTRLIAPYIQGYQSIYASGVSTDAGVLGVTGPFFDIVKLKLAEGRRISTLDKGQLFCVIGSKLAQKIRDKGVQPLHTQILVGDEMLTVVGIAQKWSPSVLFYADIDDGLVVPLTTAELLNSKEEINNVLFKLVEDPDLVAAQARILTVVSRLAPSKKVQFRNPQQIIDVIGKQRTTFTLLLASIGGISLLVGGIGVMNIMLVSVIERRREIGIRMAVGARRSDILKMFLIESVVLTLFGGLFGVAIGLAVSLTLAFFSGWAYHFYGLPPLLGFAVSVLVGVFSGFYPALRASQLDPVQTFAE